MSRKTAGRGAQGAPFVHPESRPENPLQRVPVDFVGSFPDPQVRVEPALPEAALIGRSNVGKSSLLNALLGRPGLARVSGSPGKTTLLNFYRIPDLYLVDLPGYGFARASRAAREGYRRLVKGYLTSRTTLAGVIWLLDIRHYPSKEDREMQQLLVESRRPVLAVFTKADKLTRSEQAKALSIARLQAGGGEVKLFSALKKQGVEETAQLLWDWTHAENP